jgi:RHS repeat-associated protein
MSTQDFSVLDPLSVSPSGDRSVGSRSRRRWVRPGRWARGVLAAALATGLVLIPVVPAAATTVGVFALPPAPGGVVDTVEQLGARPGATRLPIPISDTVQASVDVGTGNVMISIDGLSLPGIHGSTGLGLTSNSLSTERSTTSGLPQRFELSAGDAGSLTRVSDGVIYEGADGHAVKFRFVSGSTSQFISPKGVKADLVRVSADFFLTSRTTGTVSTFDTEGRIVSVADRNGNKVSYTHGADGMISRVVSSSGGLAGARVATITADVDEVRISQTNSGQTRSVVFEKDSTNDLEAVVDANGKRTLFSTWSGQVRRITTPEGRVTRFEYDAQERLVRLIRANGATTHSVTRLAYPSDTQTLVAGPNTNQSQAVNTVPRTTYTLNATDRVTAVTDPMGRARSSTYTADFDTATATSGTGATGGTTTNTYGANNGQSLTQSTSPTGAAGKAAYDNTAAATKYLPTSTTDSAGNKSLYTYNGAGNQLTTTDATAAQAALTYNPDGTVATATAPSSGSNATKYTYNGIGQLTGITPVTGSSLGAQSFTYDIWARPATATTGDGDTITYAYDAMGRVTREAYSDGTPAVSYVYDADGLMTSRTDGTGTTTWVYDDLGRLASRQHSAIGEKVSYGYDLASNQTSVTDGRGTTEYDFDASGTPTTVWYDSYGVTERTDIATDNRGRRTDVWLETNAAHTDWAAHQHTDYDKTGRVTRTIAKLRTDNGTTTTVQDKTYCYDTGATVGGACTPTTTANDRAKIQWVKDAVDGSTTAYTYDAKGQLTKATRTGGDTPKVYTYKYDPRGNRETSVASGPYPATNFTFNPANQITTTGYAYDGAGNLTKDPKGSYAYNAAGQLTTATLGSTSYDYSYAGGTQTELVAQSTPNGDYEYTYGRTNQFGLPVIEQVTWDGDTAYLENDPVTGQPLMMRSSGGTQMLYLYDGIGNPEAMVTNLDTTAYDYDYDPYGVPTLTHYSGGEAQPINPYQFKGGIHDRTTDWVKHGHRWYSTATGRFTQRDTLDAPLDPANANRYTFAANDPINNTDPLGLFSANEAVGLLAGAAVGLIFTVPGVIAGGAAVIVVSAAVGGCVAGAVGEGTTNELDGDKTSLSDVAGSCLVGGAIGGATAGLGLGVAGALG